MNEALKKLNEETKNLLIASLQTKAVTDLIAAVKSASDSDSGSFKIVVSTADQDRQGESVKQEGWNLTFFKSNPVVLWAHDYKALPIGMCTSIEVKDGKLVAEGKFAPMEANPFAQQVRKLYDLGMVNTTSVGFIPQEFDAKSVNVITKSELLEFSFVPVPANPYALRLSQIKELGIDCGMLKTKGLEITEEKDEVKAEKKGEVADRIAEMNETKWRKYRAVCDVMDAAASVYFDENTPGEDFTKIIGEAADILKTIAGSTGTEDEMKAIDEKVIVLFAGKESMKGKAEKNAEKITSSLKDLITAHFAFGSLALSNGKKNDKGESVANGSKSSSALLEINDFVATRELLRSMDRSIEVALRNFNIAAKQVR